MTRQKPWLNGDGSFKNDAELLEINRSWHPDIWEEYLCLFDVERQESVVLPPEEIDKFSSEEAVQLSDNSDEILAEEHENILFSAIFDQNIKLKETGHEKEIRKSLLGVQCRSAHQLA